MCQRRGVCVMSGDESQAGVRGGVTQITPTDGHQEGSKVSDPCVYVCVKMIYPGRKEYKKECVCVCVELWVGEWNERPWPGAALTWAIIATAPTLSLPKRGDATRERRLPRPVLGLLRQTLSTRIRSPRPQTKPLWAYWSLSRPRCSNFCCAWMEFHLRYSRHLKT